MRYVLQVNTGSFETCSVTPKMVTDKLRQLISLFPVDSVIFGWNADYCVNKEICRLLDAEGIEKYLWLPVFSEVLSPENAHPFITIDGLQKHAIELCRDESFEFVCPASIENIHAASATFASLATGLSLDGVFLDRIRYPSVANFPRALIGCQCDPCLKLYRGMGIDTDELHALGPGDFLPIAVEKALYSFENPIVQRLFEVRREIITSAAKLLCAEFHGIGLRVGIDTFAPIISDFVGQDICALGEVADFVKPMMYQRTFAPAGIPFELQLLERYCGDVFAKRMSSIWGDSSSGSAYIQQLRTIKACCSNIFPGIEVNRIEGICSADAAYILQSFSAAESAGCEVVVLSWDVLRMPPEHIEAIARYSNEVDRT